MTFLLAALLVSIPTLSPGVNAADEPGGSSVPEPQTFNASLPLASTPAAPVGANGLACLTASNRADGWSSTLSVETHGLDPGAYQLSAILKANGPPVLLGWVIIPDPTFIPPPEVERNLQHDNSTHQSVFLKSQTRLTLPGGLDPGAIAWVTLADAGGTTMLTSKPPSAGE